MSEIKVIKGEGGGKGGGSSQGAVEADNTLRSSALVRILELLSEGEVVGVVGGLKGVYLNDTPVQNDDGSLNFQRVNFDERVGLPSQPYMPGFPSAEDEVDVNTPVTHDAAVVKAVSSANVDAVRVTIQLPQGLSKQDMKNGNLDGFTVTIAIDARLQGGAWSQVGDLMIIEGKTTKAYERAYNISRPMGTGIWEVRVRRISPDPANSAERNQTTFIRMTEIEEVKLEYENSAYVGIAVDAESVGTSIPRRSYRLKGLKVKVPSNYDPDSRTYAGMWDGTFNVAWTENPAWVIYDLLTHPRYGMGEFISEDQIDKFSFYACARYNDAVDENGYAYGVDSGDGFGTREARFTFNSPIVVRDEAIKLLMNIAGMMRATLIYSGGLISINQDRPSNPVKLVTKANVINGRFTRSTSPLMARTTQVNVTWNNKDNRFLPKTSTVLADDDARKRYGTNSIDIAAYGATSEGQALRAAKWIIETNLNQTEIIKYQSSFAQFDLKMGDVIKIYDENFANHVGAGKIVSATGNTVTLDRDVTIQANATIDVQDPSGIGYVTRGITNAAGTYRVLNLSANFASTPLAKADYIVTSSVAPQLFRVWDIKQSEPNVIDIEAIEYDPNKWTRVEGGITLPDPVFTDINQNIISNPRNLTAATTSKVTSNGSVSRGLLISWDPPASGIPVSYNIKYRVNNGLYRYYTNIKSPNYEIDNIDTGKYDAVVYAVSVNGKQSSGAQITYNADFSGGSGSVLTPVQNLQVVGGGQTFTGSDLFVEWLNPSSNDNSIIGLRDFEVRVYDTATSTLLRTEWVPAVGPAVKAKFDYTFSKNTSDGGPRRSVRIEVYARDTNNLLSTATTKVFTNPAPSQVANFQALGGVNSVKVTFDTPNESDYKGVLIWQGTTATFTPSSANLSFDGTVNYVSLTGMPAGQTYYYRIAAYDTFGKSYDGSGLNVSGALQATVSSGVGTPMGATLPTTGMADGDFFYNTTDKHLYTYNGATAKWVMIGNRSGTATQMNAVTGMAVGDQFYNTTDGQLYTYSGTTWVAEGVSSGASNPTTGNIGDLFFNTTDKLLYRYTGTAWVSSLPTTQLTGTISLAQIDTNVLNANNIKAGTFAAGVVYAGTVSATNITSGTLSTGVVYSGTINANQVNAGSFNAGVIYGGVINGTQISAGTFAGDRIIGNSITADKINCGALSAITANLGYIISGGMDIQSLNGGWGYVKSWGKWWRDGNNGFLLGRNVDGGTIMEFQGGNSTFRMSSWSDNYLKFGDNFSVDGAGNVYAGSITIRRATQIAASAVNFDGWANQQDVAGQGIRQLFDTYWIDTGYDNYVAVWDNMAPQISARVRCSNSYYSYFGGAPGGNVLDVETEPTVVFRLAHYPQGAVGVPMGRIWIKVNVYVTPNVRQIYRIGISRLEWSLLQLT